MKIANVIFFNITAEKKTTAKILSDTRRNNSFYDPICDFKLKFDMHSFTEHIP